MTTRRSFLRSLLAAVVLAPIVSRMTEAMQGKVAPKPAAQEWLVNPEYANAEFEADINFSDLTLSEEDKEMIKLIHLGPIPSRYKLIDGQYVEVWPGFLIDIP